MHVSVTSEHLRVSPIHAAVFDYVCIFNGLLMDYSG